MRLLEQHPAQTSVATAVPQVGGTQQRPR